MKFKKFLAAFLAGALVVTGSGVSNLALLGNETVFAATEDESDSLYTLSFASSTSSNPTSTPIEMNDYSSKSNIEVVYGDNLTINAEVVKGTGNKTTQTGDVIYNWKVYDEVNKKEIYSSSSSIGSVTFKANNKAQVTKSYTVTVDITQLYTSGNNTVVKTFNSRTFGVEVVKKELSSTDVLANLPDFNSMYVSYTAKETPTEAEAVRLILKQTNGTGAQTFDNTYGTWKAVQIGGGSKENQLTAKDYPVSLQFRPNDNYTVKSDDSGWTKEDNNDVVNTTKTLTVLAPAQHVTDVKVNVENGDIKVVKSGNEESTYSIASGDALVYNAGLSSESSYELDDIKLKIDYDVDKLITDDATVSPVFKSSDDKKVKIVGYNASTKILTLQAVGADAKSYSDVTITASDSAGSAFDEAKTFKVRVYKGVQESDLTGFASIDSKYVYTGKALTDVFNYVEVNSDNSKGTDEQKKYQYTVKVNTNEVDEKYAPKANDKIQFIGHYSLGNGEKIIELKDNVYSTVEAKIYNGARSFEKIYPDIIVAQKQITEDDIKEAIEAITLKVGGAKLSGNTSVDYGTVLTEDATSGLDAHTDKYVAPISLLDHLYYLDETNNRYVKVNDASTSTEIKMPKVGEQTKYTFRYDANDTTIEGNDNYSIAASAIRSYPITFTVKESTLKLKDITGGKGADYQNYDADADAISGSLQLSDNKSDVYLHTLQQSYIGSDKDYTFAYVWTDSNGNVKTSSVKNDVSTLKLDANTNYNGTYTCTVTATPIKDKDGQLSTLTARTTVNVFVSNMQVLARETDARGKVDYVGSDLGATSTNLLHINTKSVSGNATYVTPATVNVGVIADSDNNFKMNATTVSIKEKTSKEVKESKTITGNSTSYTPVEWLLPQLPHGEYEIWLESSSTDGKTTQSYNKKIYDYTVGQFDASTLFADGKNYKRTSETDQIEYGKLPNDVLTYEFALATNSTAYTTAEVNAINQYVKDNYDVTILASKNIIYEVKNTSTPIQLTISKKNNASDNFTPTTATVTDSLGNFKIVKKELALTPEKESYTWTLGSYDNEAIKAKFTGFVNGQSASDVGLTDNSVTMEVVDKDGNKIDISNIGVGKYTVKFGCTEDLPNYSINTDATAALVVEAAKAKLTGITANDITLRVGDSKKITVSQLPATASDLDAAKLTYKSDDEDVVTVDASGNASAKANGKTTIKVTYTDADNEIEYTATINVTVSSSTDTYTKEEYDEIASANATLKNELDQANDEAKKAQADLAEANNKLEQAETALTTASANASKAQADLAKAESDLEDANNKLTQAETDLNTTKGELETAKTDAATAKADLTKAQTAQATAEANLKTAETNLANAQAAQKAAKTAQEKAEAAQKAAEKKATAAVAVKKGDTFIVGKNIYQITNVSKKTAKFVGTYSKAKTITIPATAKNSKNNVKYKVTTVAASALKGNTTATKVTIGKNVTKINGSAFNGCTKLATVTIGKSVKTIGKSAFNGCTKLKKVTIKSSKLKTVKAKAFKIAKKAKVKVPSAKVKAYKKLLKSAGLPSTATVSK